MKKFFVFIVLTCVLGNRALAQNSERTTYTMTAEMQDTIDFTGWNVESNWVTSGRATFTNNQLISATGTNNTDGSTLTRDYTQTYPNNKQQFLVYVGDGNLGDAYSSPNTSTSTNIYWVNNGIGQDFPDSWTNNNAHITIKNDNNGNNRFANAKVGDIIRFYVHEKRDAFNPQLKRGDQWYTDFPYTLPYDEGYSGGFFYFQWTINNENALTEIRNNGISLQGTGFTLRAVDLISVNTSTSTDNSWQIWTSRDHNETYLQKAGANDDYFTITGLNQGDKIIIWGDNGQNNEGGCTVVSNNTNRNNQRFQFATKWTDPNNSNNVISQSNKGCDEIVMQSDGDLKLRLDGQYSGIRKVVIRREFEHVTTFDYDPGYEEYDMYDEFSFQKNGLTPTTYSLTGQAGFQQNGTDAKYAKFSGSKITTNNRIALNNTNWTFDFGMVPGGTNGEYSFLSICNLREGDRVVISYINDSESPLIFASGGNSTTGFTYNGCAAFKDDDRDGVLDEGEKSISQGDVSVEWHRGEGNIRSNDNGITWNNGKGDYISYTPELNYINSYVITQDGHLDLAFKRNVFTYDAPHDPEKIVSRIVKIKIFSDHQAMMVDKWEEAQKHYKAYYNITGELQAKEHIMPGGLEIFVGNSDASQHALVVSSKDGPVSWVNAVDGFKIPGITKNGDQVNINFDLGVSGNGNYANLPQTGTFYRFVPEVNGKMSFKFEAKSMNYYRYDLKGSDIYYNDNWVALNDRPNEQTVDAACPYYLVTVETVNGNKQITSIKKLNNNQDIDNGGEWEEVEFAVQKGKEYYLFGGWNNPDLYYTSSWPNSGIDISSDASDRQYNNIEGRPTQVWTTGCGVAQLLWVTFDPNKKIYPLAKWVPNGTSVVGYDDENVLHGVPNPDTFATETDLADLWGYEKDHTTITIKKMAGNIQSCEPYIVDIPQDQQVEGGPTAKLMIKNIQFVSGNNPGGTILIKLDAPSERENPLYALTIAYSADSQYDNQQSEVIKDGNAEGAKKPVRGHIWDFHTKSLNGLTWNPQAATWHDQEQTLPKTYVPNTSVATEMGTYFQNYYSQSIAGYGSALEVQTALPKNDGKNGDKESFLFDEVEDEEKGDWMFNYNLQYDGYLIDPVFTNKYDMAGDNADMIWDTEGTIFQTSANQCGIFNEYGQVIDHTVTSTTDDPNRYVALLKGGKFRIPWLMPNDRVIIWMGSGTGRTDDFASLKIRNAYDALHNPIDPEDDYIVGGSQWNGANGDANYRGCYHFFAKGNENSTATGKAADMVFEMTGGEMCKIYKVRIYRGDRIITNEVVGVTLDNDGKPTGNHDNYLLWSTAVDPNDGTAAKMGPASNWSLNYFGKDQKLADGTNNVVNEIIAKTGNIDKTKISTIVANNTFTYPHALGEIGTFRVRGKDMEKNMKYVADYADHNITVAYQETQKYPYTWDFMDMTGYKGQEEDESDGNNALLFEPEEQLGEGKPDNEHQGQEIPPSEAGVSANVWNSIPATSYQKTARDLSLWEVHNTAGNYFLRLNSQVATNVSSYPTDKIFETAKNIDGNQIWANGQVIPETQGLWFYTEDNVQTTAKWIISDDGMSFYGTDHTFVVPNVPADAAVYLRMETIPEEATSCSYMLKDMNGKTDFVAGTDYSVYGPTQVDGTSEYILAIKNNGTTKKHLILALGNYELKKVAVSKDWKTVNKKGYASESHKRVIDHSLTSFFTGKNIKAYTAEDYNASASTIALVEIDKPMPAATADGQTVGSVLYNNDYYKDENGNEYGQIVILDGGFHLFVPDMHDYTGDPNDPATMSSHSGELMGTSRNMMKSYNVGGTQNATIDQKGSDGVRYVLSYRYFEHDKEGQTIENTQTTDADNEAFYRVAKGGALIKPNSAYISFPTTSQAKVSFLFGDDLFGDVDDGIATGISDAADRKADRKGEWYSLDGRKLNGAPTEKGLYIVNGKKVLVK